MNETAQILRALDEHRAETRADMKELRSALSTMAEAMAEMGRTMARSEERHASHESGMHRIGHQIDDHEARLRYIERHRTDPEQCRRHQEKLEAISRQLNTNTIRLSTGWGAFVAGCAGLTGLAGLAFAAYKAFGG